MPAQVASPHSSHPFPFSIAMPAETAPPTTPINGEFPKSPQNNSQETPAMEGGDERRGLHPVEHHQLTDRVTCSEGSWHLVSAVGLKFSDLSIMESCVKNDQQRQKGLN